MNQEENSLHDNQISNKQIKQNLEYEEPVLRDVKNILNKEQINRLNPIDFEIYNKIDSSEDFKMQHKNINYQNESYWSGNRREQFNTNDFKKSNFNNENNDQSFFSVNNFKNTGNPFISNNLISTKFAFNKNQINNNTSNQYSNYNNNANDSVVGKIIRAKEPDVKINFIDKNQKIKNANVLVEEFMKDISKVNLINFFYFIISILIPKLIRLNP